MEVPVPIFVRTKLFIARFSSFSMYRTPAKVASNSFNSTILYELERSCSNCVALPPVMHNCVIELLL